MSTMWTCSECHKTFDKRVLLLDHVNNAHVLNNFGFQYVCGQEKCYKRFNNFYLWSRHLQKKHSYLDNITVPTCNNIVPDDSCEIDALPGDSNLSLPDNAPNGQFESCNPVEAIGARFVSGLRSNPSVTVSTCEQAISGCHEVLEVIIEKLKCSVAEATKGKLSDSELESLLGTFDDETRPLDFIATDWKQKSYFHSKLEFVEPVQYCYGAPRYETTGTTKGLFQKPVYDSWQYIPLLKTLKAILSQPGVIDLLENNPSTDGIIRSFKDGSVFRNHPLFSDRGKISVALELYYDDLEPANALGSKATIHKLGIFYVTILNLPDYFNSSPVSHHLLALAYTQDLKKYGYDMVLNKIAEDLLVLETVGCSVEIGAKIFQIFGSLGDVNGDCLGQHTLFGLLESFRAHLFCDHCTVRNQQIQYLFHKNDFQNRDPETFDQQVKGVLAGKLPAKSCGIKGWCPLNALPNWHIVTNCVSDLMHVHLEGVGPYQVKLVLWKLSESNQISLSQLNSRISGFVYGDTDGKNRPSSIPNLNPDDHSLKQKAFQFFCLFRLLPLIIGDFIDPEDPFWLFYLELRHISDILFAQKWTVGLAGQYEEALAEHQRRFKELFPEFNLIPKDHILCHFGEYALATGPPYKNMVASQEMKGSFYKRSATVMGNFKNAPYTLAWKNQFFACNSLLSGNLLKNRVEFRDAELVSVDSLPCSSGIRECLTVNSDNEVLSVTALTFRGQAYREGNVLVLDRKSGEVSFGKMHCVITSESMTEKLYAIVAICETLYFHDHFWSYVVKVKNDCALVDLESLLDYHPLDLYSSGVPHEYFVVPRYALF